MPPHQPCPAFYSLRSAEAQEKGQPFGSPISQIDRGSEHSDIQRRYDRSNAGPAFPSRLRTASRQADRASAENLNILNFMQPVGMREMGIQEARPVLGDLVRDAQRHGIETRLTRNGRPAAMIARLSGIEVSAAECEKALARYADDPGMMLTGAEQEAVRMVRAVLTRIADEERDAR